MGYASTYERVAMKNLLSATFAKIYIFLSMLRNIKDVIVTSAEKERVTENSFSDLFLYISRSTYIFILVRWFSKLSRQAEIRTKCVEFIKENETVVLFPTICDASVTLSLAIVLFNTCYLTCLC